MVFCCHFPSCEVLLHRFLGLGYGSVFLRVDLQKDNHKAFDPDMGSSLSSRLVSGSGGERSFENMDRDVLAGAAEPGKGFFLSFFIPRRDFWAIPLLLGCNILVFFVMCLTGVGVLEPDNISLLHWGANFGPLTLTGDYWRVWTCNFVHSGLIHLIMNVYALLFVGLFLEPMLGSLRVVMVYSLAGLYSSVAGLFCHADWISVGASGAIFGLYGALFARLLFYKGQSSWRKILLIAIGGFILYNLLYGIGDNNVDNAAHTGGLVAGFLLGVVYGVADKVREKGKRMVVACLAEFVLLSELVCWFSALTHGMPPDYQDVREAWRSGQLEAYVENGETGIHPEEDGMGQNREYTVVEGWTMTDQDVWIPFSDEASGFSFRYPSNWHRKPDGWSDFRIENGLNWMTIEYSDATADTDAQGMRDALELSVCDGDGHLLVGCTCETVVLNGVEFVKVSSPQRISLKDGKWIEARRTTYGYYKDKPLRCMTIVQWATSEPFRKEMDEMAQSFFVREP